MGNFFRSKPNIIILVTIILCRYDGPYSKGDRKGHQPLRLINSKFLGIFDDMFYRLPFPNALELERMLKRNEVILAGNEEFLSSMRAELDEERALGDFERGWKKYLAERVPPSAKTKIVYSSFAERNRSLTPETDGATGSAGGGGAGEAANEESAEGLLPPMHDPVWHLGSIIRVGDAGDADGELLRATRN